MTTSHPHAHSGARPTEEQQLHFTPPKNHRFFFLDALRGIAALFVVAFHFPPTMTSSAAANGPLAVDFFFCLSGFVIAFSYENRLTETLSFKDFTVARLIRLYPIYAMGSLLGLLSSILILRFVLHSTVLWSGSFQLFILAFFIWPTRLSPLNSTDNFPLNGPAWSLFYEILANLAYALLIKLRMARTTVLLCIVACSLALLTNTVASGHALDVGPRQSELGLGFARVSFSFFLGVLIFRFYRSRPKNAEVTWIQRLLPVIITLMLIGILSSPLSWMRTESFRLLALSLCFPAMVYYGAMARLPHSIMRLSTALGELSYPLYLLHSPIVSLMRARRLLSFAAAHTTLVHFLVVCMVAALAYISWWAGEHIDLPIRRALTRRYNAYKQSKLTAVSPQASISEIRPAQHDDA